MSELLAPHMDSGEVSLFKQTLRSGETYLEFGCGGSTVVACESGVKHITSVDTHPDWIKRCSSHPSVAKRIANEQAKLIYLDIGELAQWGKPANRDKVYLWPAYSIGVWAESPRLPDVVLVDGRWRVACGLQALLRCRDKARIIVHDWTARPKYHILLEFASIVGSSGSMVVLAPDPKRDLGKIAQMALAAVADYA